MTARQKKRGGAPQPTAAPRIPVALICAALAAVTIAAYTPVWQFDFIALDDPGYITDNPAVSGGLSWSGLHWAFTKAHEANWHPLTWLSHMLDVDVFGLSAGPHHAVNLLLHVLATLLLFAALRALTGALWRPTFVAAVFAVHPLHVESVAWVAERKDVLSGVFFMLTLLAYARYRRAPSTGRYAAVVLALALGLMSKPMLVTAPFVLILIDWWMGDFGPKSPSGALRASIVNKIPLFAIVAVTSVITFITQQEFGATKSLTLFPVSLRVQNAVVSYVEYLKDAVWPSGLGLFYPFPAAVPVDQLLGAAAVLIVVTGAVVMYARRDRVWATGWFWCVGMLVPVSGIAQVGNQARADRFMYLPLIGLTIAVAWGLGGRIRTPTMRRVAGAIATVIVVACAFATHAQVQHWRNTETLWTHTARATEGTANFGVYLGLGEYLRAKSRPREAVSWYEGAVQRNPESFEARAGLGTLLAEVGRLPEAVDHLGHAARIRPDSSDVHWRLALAYAGTGRLIDALPEFAEAARLAPEYAPIRGDYGGALAQHGQTDAGIREMREALRLDPALSVTRLNLARVLHLTGQTDAAVRELRELLQRSPGHPGALKLLEAIGKQ